MYQYPCLPWFVLVLPDMVRQYCSSKEQPHPSVRVLLQANAEKVWKATPVLPLSCTQAESCYSAVRYAVRNRQMHQPHEWSRGPGTTHCCQSHMAHDTNML